MSCSRDNVIGDSAEDPEAIRQKCEESLLKLKCKAEESETIFCDGIAAAEKVFESNATVSGFESFMDLCFSTCQAANSDLRELAEENLDCCEGRFNQIENGMLKHKAFIEQIRGLRNAAANELKAKEVEESVVELEETQNKAIEVNHSEAIEIDYLEATEVVKDAEANEIKSNEVKNKKKKIISADSLKGLFDEDTSTLPSLLDITDSFNEFCSATANAKPSRNTETLSENDEESSSNLLSEELDVRPSANFLNLAEVRVTQNEKSSDSQANWQPSESGQSSPMETLNSLAMSKNIYLGRSSSISRLAESHPGRDFKIRMLLLRNHLPPIPEDEIADERDPLKDFVKLY